MIFTPPALLPPHEDKRLATLHTYHILHALREPLFAELAELAATLFDVPISLIALVGADEVEYIATHGLPGLRSQPRVEAVCSLAVQQQQAVIFLDLAASTAALTPEAAAAARAKNLRFYAGVPLSMPDRQCIGTLCLIDRRPRTFSAPEQQVLEQLARLAGQFIVVREYCTAHPTKSVEYWCLVRSELTQEVHTLLASAQRLIGYVGARIPVSASVLEAIHGRLHELYWRLADYYPASAPS